MDNEVQVFTNRAFGKVRVVMLDGEPWFVGSDVASALGYANPNDALIRHVPSKYKGTSSLTTPYGVQNFVVINEAGLYRLIMRSHLESAEEFSDWLCEDVVPSIRKTGSYSVDASKQPGAPFAWESDKNKPRPMSQKEKVDSMIKLAKLTEDNDTREDIIRETMRIMGAPLRFRKL